MGIDLLDDSARVRLLRVVARLSQAEVAARAGIDRRRLSEFERGERALPDPELGRVRAALGASEPGAEGAR